MPHIILKATGRSIPVTDEGLEKIKGNPLTKDNYTYPKASPPAEEPEEVTNLRKNKNRKHVHRSTTADVQDMVSGDQQSDSKDKGDAKASADS